MTLKVGYGVVRDTSTQDVRLASGAFENTPYEIKWVPFQTGSLEALIAGAVDLVPDTMVLNAVLAQGGAKTPWTCSTAPFSIIGASVAPPEAGAVIGVHPGIRHQEGRRPEGQEGRRTSVAACRSSGGRSRRATRS